MIYCPVTISDNFKTLSEWKEQWEHPEQMGWVNYVGFKTHPEDALILCKLLFPKFLKLENFVFLEMNYSEEALKNWQMELTSPIEIEKVMNHVHIYDIFSHSENIEESSFEEFAEVLAVSWKMSLAKCFPDIGFQVMVSNSDTDYGPTVTFFQDN